MDINRVYCTTELSLVEKSIQLILLLKKKKAFCCAYCILKDVTGPREVLELTAMFACLAVWYSECMDVLVGDVGQAMES